MPFDERRGMKEIVERAGSVRHPNREPSDPPGSFPPPTVPGAGSRSPTIDRMRIEPRSLMDKIGLGKALWGIGVAVVTWVGARISTLREDIRSDMATVAASAAASAAADAIAHRFDDHPLDAYGQPQESLSDKLKGTARIVQWAGTQADAQVRTDREIVELKTRVGELEAKRKPK